MMVAVRHVRNLPVPEEFLFPVMVIDDTNYSYLDVPLDQRACPAWETVVN